VFNNFSWITPNWLNHEKSILCSLVIGLLCSLSMNETVWTQDKMHSQLNFSAIHFEISHVEDRLRSFTVNIKSEKADFSDAQI
jgi:polyisoprenoid-binding protein YceI